MTIKSLCFRFMVILAMTSSVAPLTFGQGTAFTYQGRLNDQGAPANGAYDLRFTIYDAVTNGNAVAVPQTNAAVMVSGGLFTAQLDFGANVFDGSARWLDVGVRTNGDAGPYAALNPRQPLTSAPYAIQAANAATATVAGSASSVAGANITGTISDARLSTNVARLNASAVFSGTVTASGFSGDGAGVTNMYLRAANSSGAILFTTNWGHFPLYSSLSVGIFPRSVIAADMNGDGRVDLISANEGDSTLSVLTNNGSGGFVLSSSPRVGQGSYSTIGAFSVTAADVNGDGKTDLISANRFADTLTVLTNDGNGGFVISSSPVVGNSPTCVISVDVNGDGKVDLISANAGSTSLSVLTNNGSGGFALSASPAAGFSDAVRAADVNGDGKVDLISASVAADRLTVLTNNGSGGFAFSSQPVVGPDPYSMTTADVNGDGRVDLISVNYTANTLTVLTNNGSGGFALSASPGTGDHPYSVTAADVNGDGRMDLISANYDADTLTVLTNNGSGGFVLSSSPGTGDGPYSLASADVDGDGRVDLICANLAVRTLSVLINTPVFPAEFTGAGRNLSGLNASQLTSGTVPLAQLPSAVVTNGASGINLGGTFTGNGAGVTNVDFRTANTVGTIAFTTNWGAFILSATPLVGGTPESIITMDVNADGKVDLISANSFDSKVIVLTNNGSGFGLSASLNVGSGPRCVTAADANGDGRMDLISANYNDSTLTVLTNNGSGGFGLRSSIGVGNSPRSVIAADVNGDGRVDLISANFNDSTLTVLVNTGADGFGFPSSLGVGNGPQCVIAADVNGDGKVDLVSANYGGNADGNTLTVLTNKGNGAFVLSSSPVVGNGPSSVIAVDINGDGKVDLISANEISGTLSVLTNNGSGDFALSSTPPGSSFPQSVTAVDVTGDGKLDLIVANTYGNALTVLTNNGSARFYPFSYPATGYRPASLAAADVNGDGRVDLIAGSSGSPRLSVLTNSMAGFAGTFIGSGSNLVDLNASSLAGGTLADARLSANVPLLDGANVFTGTNRFAGVVMATNVNSQFAGTFNGNGNGLTNLNASQLTSGTVNDARLSANVPLLNGNNVFTGNNTFSTSVDRYVNIDKSANTIESGLALRTAGAAQWYLFTDDNAGSQDDFKILSANENDTAPRFHLPRNNGNVHLAMSGGKVGIRTAPATPLHIKQSADGNINVLDAGIRLERNTTSDAWNIQVWSDNDLVFRFNNGAYGYINDGTGAYGSSSDRRLKKDIEPLTSMLGKVLALRPVSYRFKAQSDDAAKSFGFIAQEVEPIFPNLVSEKAGYKGLTYDSFIPVAVGAIQELHQTAKAQEGELHHLQKQNGELEKQVRQLQQQLATQTQVNQKLEARFERMEKVLETMQSQTLPAGGVVRLAQP